MKVIRPSMSKNSLLEVAHLTSAGSMLPHSSSIVTRQSVILDSFPKHDKVIVVSLLPSSPKEESS